VRNHPTIESVFFGIELPGRCVFTTIARKLDTHHKRPLISMMFFYVLVTKARRPTSVLCSAKSYRLSAPLLFQFQESVVPRVYESHDFFRMLSDDTFELGNGKEWNPFIPIKLKKRGSFPYHLSHFFCFGLNGKSFIPFLSETLSI